MKTPHTCGKCGEPIRFVGPESLPLETVAFHGIEALKKIGEFTFGLFPMNYEDKNDYKIHHCALDTYFRIYGEVEQKKEGAIEK